MPQGGNSEALDSERLLREWRWFCPQSLTVIDRNAFGDLFLKDEAGRVHMLNVGLGDFTLIAESVPEFRTLAVTSDKQKQWFQKDASMPPKSVD